MEHLVQDIGSGRCCVRAYVLCACACACACVFVCGGVRGGLVAVVVNGSGGSGGSGGYGDDGGKLLGCNGLCLQQ
jgi:hypothetical protein